MSIMEKRQLRRHLRDRLAAINPQQRRDKSQRACERLIQTESFNQAKVVMMFLSLSQEIDVSPAIEAAWRAGKAVVVPKALWESRLLLPMLIQSWEDALEEGPGGVRHPAAAAGVPLDTIDLVVTPGLGFDRQGNRLGRGMAFYDCFFAQPELRATRCGFAFFEQMVDQIPVTEHDKAVHFLVTDEQVVWPKR